MNKNNQLKAEVAHVSMLISRFESGSSSDQNSFYLHRGPGILGALDSDHDSSHSSARTLPLVVDELDTPAGIQLPTDATCEVCYTRKPEKDGVRTCHTCLVRTCFDCFGAWLEIRINGGHSTDLTCVKCAQSVSPEEVEVFCPRLYKKHLYFLSKDEQRDNPLAAWCPKEDCWTLLLDVRRRLSPSDKETTCPGCSSTLCAKCFSFAHDGERCATPHVAFGHRALAHFWQRLHTKKCPQCGVRIQRSGGCTQMRCTSCQTKFCWRCRGLLHGSAGRLAQGRGLHMCYCPRVTGTFVAITAAGGLLLIAPITLAAAAVVGPPALIVFAALPKDKKDNIRLELAEFLNSI